MVRYGGRYGRSGLVMGSANGELRNDGDGVGYRGTSADIGLNGC